MNNNKVGARVNQPLHLPETSWDPSGPLQVTIGWLRGTSELHREAENVWTVTKVDANGGQMAKRGVLKYCFLRRQRRREENFARIPILGLGSALNNVSEQ